MFLIRTPVDGDYSPQFHKAAAGTTQPLIQIFTFLTYSKAVFIDRLICFTILFDPVYVGIQILHIGILVHFPQQTFPTGIFSCDLYCFCYLFFFHNCSYRLFYPEHNDTACRHGKGDPAIRDLILRKYFFVYLIGILKGVVSMHIIG